MFSQVWDEITYTFPIFDGCTMGLLPDTQNCGCACAGNAGNVFPVTAGKRSRHASRHVRHARAVMHAGIANYRFPLKSAAGDNVPGIPGACATCNFTYLVRGPLKMDATTIHVSKKKAPGNAIWCQKSWSSLYPPHNKVVGGYIGFTPSVRPSRVHPASHVTWWLIVNWTPMNKYQINLQTQRFLSQTCIWKCCLQMSAILFRPQCVNDKSFQIIFCWSVVNIIDWSTKHWVL